MWSRLSVRVSVPKLRFLYLSVPIFLFRDLIQCLYEIIALGIWVFPKATSLKEKASGAFRRIMIKFLVNGAVVYSGIQYLNMGTMKSERSLLWFCLILLLMNMFVRPLLLLVSLPISMISFGAFSLFINTWVLQWSDALVRGLRIEGFLNRFVMAFVIYILQIYLSKITIEK